MQRCQPRAALELCCKRHIASIKASIILLGGLALIFPTWTPKIDGENVVIEDDVWIGSGAIIAPGVTIGKGSVIGAGSVVTKDVPQNVIAVGNPCKVLREITENDRIYYYKNMRVDEVQW